MIIAPNVPFTNAPPSTSSLSDITIDASSTIDDATSSSSYTSSSSNVYPIKASSTFRSPDIVKILDDMKLEMVQMKQMIQILWQDAFPTPSSSTNTTTNSHYTSQPLSRLHPAQSKFSASTSTMPDTDRHIRPIHPPQLHDHDNFPFPRLRSHPSQCTPPHRKAWLDTIS